MPLIPRKLDHDRVPWSRQRGEPQENWDAFQRYLADDQRDIVKAWPPEMTATKSGPMKVRARAKYWCWEQRAYAVDREIEKKWIDGQARRLIELRGKHVKIAQLHQALGTRELQKLMRKSIDSIDPIMSVKDAAAITELGIRLERLALGVAETVVGTQNTTSYVDDLKEALRRNDREDDAPDLLPPVTIEPPEAIPAPTIDGTVVDDGNPAPDGE